jgi:hypothetical protein
LVVVDVVVVVVVVVIGPAMPYTKVPFLRVSIGNILLDSQV